MQGSEDESDVSAPETGRAIVVEGEDIIPGDGERAAVGALAQARDLEQRRLAEPEDDRDRDGIDRRPAEKAR
jgi:hypothetical protein